MDAFAPIIPPQNIHPLEGAYRRFCKQWLPHPHIQFTGIGKKRQGGNLTEAPSIVIFVARKRPLDEIPVAYHIPTEWEGWAIDVEQCEMPIAAADDPLMGGISLVSEGNPGGKGTLGCFAHKLDSDGNRNGETVLITNTHVITDDASRLNIGMLVGEENASRGCELCNCDQFDAVVTYPCSPKDTCDAATATLIPGKQWRAEVKHLGPIRGTHSVSLTDIMNGDYKVRKYGNKTGYTEGIVRCVQLFSSPYDPTVLTTNPETSTDTNTGFSSPSDNPNIHTITTTIITTTSLSNSFSHTDAPSRIIVTAPVNPAAPSDPQKVTTITVSTTSDPGAATTVTTFSAVDIDLGKNTQTMKVVVTTDVDTTKTLTVLKTITTVTVTTSDDPTTTLTITSDNDAHHSMSEVTSSPPQCAVPTDESEKKRFETAKDGKTHFVKGLLIQYSGGNNSGGLQFAHRGDSGSVIVNDENKVVGLLYAISDESGYYGYADDIKEVEKALGVEIAVYDDADPTKTVEKTTKSRPQPCSEEAIKAAEDAAEAASNVLMAGMSVQAFARMSTPLRNSLVQHPLGKTFLTHFDPHLREISLLVNKNRACMVAWRRHKGPQFLGYLMAYLKNPEKPLPKDLTAAALEKLLATMSHVLQANGSTPLRKAIEAHGPDLLEQFRKFSQGLTDNTLQSHVA